MGRYSNKSHGSSYVVQSVIGVGTWAALSAVVTVRAYSATQLSWFTQLVICTFLWGSVIYMVFVLRRYYQKLPGELPPALGVMNLDEAVALCSDRNFSYEDVESLCAAVGGSRRAALNTLSLDLAKRYAAGVVSFEVADSLMNDIFMYGGRCGELPEPMMSIYLAFDAGGSVLMETAKVQHQSSNTRGLKLREFFRVKMPPNDALQRSPTTLRFSGRTRRTAHRTPGPERRIGRRDSSLILVEIFNAVRHALLRHFREPRRRLAFRE